MENNIKEEFNICDEIKSQQDKITIIFSISEKILQTLRGKIPEKESESLRDECLIDGIKINNEKLFELEQNINEIARKIMG